TRHVAWRGLPPGNLEDQLGASRFDEFFALTNWYDESSRTADDAVFVVNVEILNIHRADVRPLEHDRQAVDGDSGGQHVVADQLHQWTGIVGAVSRHVDHPAQAFIAAVVKQRLGEAQSARNRGARRAAVRRGRNLGCDSVGGFRSVDQPPGHDDLLIGLAGPFKISNGDLAVSALAQSLQ